MGSYRSFSKYHERKERYEFDTHQETKPGSTRSVRLPLTLEAVSTAILGSIGHDEVDSIGIGAME